MKRLTREWVRKAEADFQVAERLASEHAAFHDAVCFHCQQSIEKYLKGLATEAGVAAPRTHNLVALERLLVSHHPSLGRFVRGLNLLTRYAVETRYPGDGANRRQATSAIKWTIRIRGECRQILKLKP